MAPIISISAGQHNTLSQYSLTSDLSGSYNTARGWHSQKGVCMGFREIFRQFLEHRQRLKAVFVASSDAAARPNCTPKLLVDIIKPNKVFYIDIKSSQSYRNVQQNWQTSLSFMDEKTFTGFKLIGRAQVLDAGGPEFISVKEEWYKRATAYEAERMVERIKGVFSGYVREITIPEDFVIMKFFAESASIAKPGRILAAMHRDRRGLSNKTADDPIEKVAVLQTRIAELERLQSKHKKVEYELRTSRDFLQKIIDGVQDPVVVIDTQRRIVMANEAVRRQELAQGLSSENLTCHKLFHHCDTPCDPTRIECPLQKVMETRQAARLVHTHCGNSGEEVFVEINATPVFDEKGRVVQMIKSHHDITERLLAEKRLEARQKVLEKTNLEDDLTSLYNHRGFVALADQQLKIAKRQGKEMFILFSDVDCLKRINDVFGHEMGDKALVDCAQILKKTFRNSDIVARIGGDEFTVAMVDCSREDLSRAEQRLRENIKEHNEHSGDPYSLGLNIGAASCAPEELSKLEQLLSRADQSMYEEKKSKQ